MKDRMLSLLRELEAADTRLATLIADVERLQRETDGLRRDADELAGFLETLPSLRVEDASAVEAAEAELDVQRRAAAAAESALAGSEQGGSEEEVAAARRAATRERDRASSLERKLGRARDELADLERRSAHSQAEIPRLDARGRELATRLAAIGRGAGHAAAAPEPGVEGVQSWAARARAALLVVRSGLETERERVVREANELAAAALGERDVAASVSVVRERLERRG